MKKINYQLIALALAAMSFTACDEEGLGSIGELEAAMGEAYVNAEATASQLFKNVDEAMRAIDEGQTLPLTIDNAEFKVDPDGTYDYILDYTNTGTNTRGLVVKGKIGVNLTGANYLDNGSEVQVAYVNYSETSGDVEKPVTGGITVTNNSTPTDTTFRFQIQNLSVQDDGVADENGDGGPKTLSLSSDKRLTWTKGADTPNDVSDDSYTIADNTGGSTQADYDNGNFTMDVTLTSPLLIDNTCSVRLVEGIIDLTISTTLTGEDNPLSFNSATIDFLAADGCSNFFQISLDSDDPEGASISDLTRQFNSF